MVKALLRVRISLILVLAAILAVALVAVAQSQRDPSVDLGRTQLLKKSAAERQADCPPQAAYGVGQREGRGCGNRPPPGQAKKND
ncbi:MAG: hypothetical protein ACRDLB_14565 [Actinomycetota bacterium]